MTHPHEGNHKEGEKPAEAPLPKSVPSVLRFGTWLVVLLAFGLVAGLSWLKYVAYQTEGSSRADEVAAGPMVHVAKLTKGPGEHHVTLVGETRPYMSATMYAKVSGYLKSVAVDKGDTVKEGQLLAVIESPETDEAYVGAAADAKNKKSILDRTQTLFDRHLVSQQEFDQAQADSEVAAAKLRAQKTLKGYENLRAPFNGTITARYADPGALVQNATNSDSGSLPVIMVSQVDRLRIDIFIDQRDATYVQTGDPVEITLSERPDFKIEGKVARISNELDPRTKMLLTEIDIPNEDHSLVAGSFVQVSMLVKSPAYLDAPVESLVLKDDKSYLTVVSDNNTLTYRQIAIGANDGKVLAVLSGAKEGERVALNIGNALPEGAKLRPIDDSPATPEKNGPAPASGDKK